MIFPFIQLYQSWILHDLHFTICLWALFTWAAHTKKRFFTFQMYTQARCIEHLLSSSGEVTWISRVYSKTCLFHIRPFANNNRCYADVALCNISSTSSFLCVVVVVSLCTCVRVNDFFCCLYIVITNIASEFEYFSLKWEQKNNEKRKQTGGGNSTLKKILWGIIIDVFLQF